MYRTAIRSAARPAARSLRVTPKRFASTASPADRPKTWKGSALRWGLAGAALYYYNTSPVFADEALPRTVAAPPTFADDELPTVDSVIEEKRQQVQKAKAEKPSPAAAAASSTPEAASSPETATSEADQVPAVGEGASALEEEAGQQGAFNPETGEINWDCPCLGGMAHGPCGEEFKTAFSCFVYSTEEPKGMDCIEKFQGMQECFRQYPEIYGAELAEEEEALQEGQAEPVAEAQKVQDNTSAVSNATASTDAEPAVESLPAPTPKTAEGVIPAEAADATEANLHVEEEPKDEGKQEKKD